MLLSGHVSRRPCFSLSRSLQVCGQTFKISDSDLWFGSVGDRVNSQAAGRSCWSGALSESAAGRVVCSGRGCCTSTAGRRGKDVNWGYVLCYHTSLFYIFRVIMKKTNKQKTNTAGRCCNEMRPGGCSLLSERLPVAKVEGFRPVDRLI